MESTPAAPAETQKTPTLAETLASFSAVSPVEGRLLEDQIAAIKANEEKMKAERDTIARELEEARRRTVDNEVLKQQLRQFENAMGADTMQRYGMADIDRVMSELTSKNGEVVGNTASRLIAACNSRFMNMQAAGAKRQRVVEPAKAAAPVAPAPPTNSNSTTQDLLRRALAATY